MKVETEKFHTNQHCIPYIPTKYPIFKKIQIHKISAKVGTETVGHFSQPNRTHGYHILSGTFRFLPNFFPALLSKRYAGAVVPWSLGGSVFYIEHGSSFLSLCMQGGTN